MRLTAHRSQPAAKQIHIAVLAGNCTTANCEPLKKLMIASA